MPFEKKEASLGQWDEIRICDDQSYHWKRMEISNQNARLRKWAEIEYFWHGPLWERVARDMTKTTMKKTSISFYKGAEIDEKNKTIFVRGEFIRDFVADKHMFFWRRFWGVSKNEQDPIIKCKGKFIKLPSIAGEQDDLRFFVNGQNVSSLEWQPEN